MSKTIVVVGFGPGVSTAVAERFGAAGFAVALVARNQDRLAAGVTALEAKGIAARAYAADANDFAALRGAIAKARTELGPITVIHWNAYTTGKAGDLLTADAATLRGIFDVPVAALLGAIQEALPDLKNSKDAAILVTNGGFGDLNPKTDAYAVSIKMMDLALANAAKHKLVGLLGQRLKAEGIYVGEVTITGTVRGTSWDNGGPSIDPALIANSLWQLYLDRDAMYARV